MINNEYEKYEKKIFEYLRGIDKGRVISLLLQTQWERDIAILQLKELGYQFGEKKKAEQKEDKRDMGSALVTRAIMPDSCENCPCSEVNNSTVKGIVCRMVEDENSATGYKRIEPKTYYYEEKPEWCPLRPIYGLINAIDKYLFVHGFGSEYRNDVANIIKKYCGVEEQE